MSMIHEERPSDSPYIDTVTQGHTLRAGSTTRPAEINWHMVIVKRGRQQQCLLVGPWVSAGEAAWGADAEILWIKFQLGVFMPHLPIKHLLNQETPLPDASSKSFWLNSAAWAFPAYDTVDTFVDRLVRENVLMCDPLINAALRDEAPHVPERTVRHRFLHATGLTQSHIRQMKRAQHAVALLQQGVSILDTVYEAGYFDQPHLTRSLRQFIGYTPAQMMRKPMTE